MPITVIALASAPRPRARGEGGEGAVVALGEAQRVLAGLAHGRHVADVGARAADVADGELQRAADAGIGAVAGTQAVGAGVDAELCGRSAPCTQSATQAVPVVVAMPRRLKSGSSDRLGRGQHDRQLGRPAAGDDALIGDGLGRDVAEHRRHQAVRIAAAGDAGHHRLEAAAGRRHQRQAVRQFGVGQDLLRGSPSSPSSSTTGQPHHSLIRRCARRRRSCRRTRG